MNHYIWPAAGTIFGISVGLLFVGYLIKPSIRSWEGSRRAQRLFFSVTAFLVGGGGGTAIMAAFSDAAPWYLLGVGLGIIWGCFHSPILLVAHTYETVFQVLQLSDALRERVSDIGERAAVVLAILAPPVSTKKSEGELGNELDAALDKLESEETDEGIQ